MKRLCLLANFFLWAAIAASQPAFQNLDFESATLPWSPSGPTFGYFPVIEALPGWTAFYGDDVQAVIPCTGYIPGASAVLLQDNRYWWHPLSGRYAAFLQADWRDPVPVGITQAGQVPTWARSLTFDATGISPNEFQRFIVSLGGNTLSLVPQFLIDRTVFSADISPWAGQTTELRFTALPSQPALNIFLDNITFSPIPEPHVWGLLGLGALGFLLRRRLGKAWRQ